MTYVSNDPSYWPYLEWSRRYNYFIVASLTMVIYDWVLTLAQEFELIWRQRYSLMNVLYVCVRYIGILFSIVYILANFQVSITDSVSNTIWFIQAWTPVIINTMLGVIMTTRIHAMYQGSRRILIFLLVVLLACTITSVVMTVIGNVGVSGVENILSGNHQCSENMNAEDRRLNAETTVPTTVWEILALCLAVWIVIKHFRELQKSPTGANIRDCFVVLMRSHMLYFITFAIVSCFNLGTLSPNMSSLSVGVSFYYGIGEVAQAMQMFVLGPRLILSLREYHAQLVVNSDEGTYITTMDFNLPGHASTGGSV
ncbi:uncharacterized protein HD556DRAFT_461956 [Suillus plorans]|uniref:DUF6533 domain-containing protein n=1 Tax=Suillus plorans TaxID=116603 RepID=A0A9P7DI31_9AGAM|nr:uncharacterized protein HD556DRAFT_461956 [Suillus plorans]KAG1793592.1 hypothetical protein HD556DRAFT_461956 [Suillus plorans]